MGGYPPRPDRVLLLVREGRDRELLEGWLESEPRYELVETDSTRSLDAVEYDLCLVDRPSLGEVGDGLRDRREAARPSFLPSLLVVPRYGDDGGRRRPIPSTAEAVVDDVVELPVGKATLRRRIDSLLRGRHASLELAAREEQYRELVRLTPEAILLVREGAVIYANQAATTFLGVEHLRELTGRPVTEFAEGPNTARLEQLLDAIDRDGRLEEFVELDLVTSDGTERTVELAGVTVTYEGEPATQLVVRDVTDERRRSERLTLYARALEASAQGVTIADARREDHPVVYANPSFERITGYETSEILGRNCRILQGEGTDPETVRTVRDAIDERRPVSVELRNYRKDGTPFWNRLDIVPVWNDEGEVTHFLGLQRDVTERREREQRVAVLERVLRHNLRNQLNVVRGEADRILVEDDLDPEASRAAAANIVRATDELLDISEQARRFREVVAGDDRGPGVRDLAGILPAAAAEIDAEYPDATVDVEVPEGVAVYAHDVIGVAFGSVLEMLADASGGACDVAVRVTEVTSGTVTLEILDRAMGLGSADLDVVGEGVETPVAHPQGVELWLLRWSVEHSGGEFGVDTTSEQPRIELRLRRATDSDGIESAGMEADD
jgi:PAS domain S-box-containing protein